MFHQVRKFRHQNAEVSSTKCRTLPHKIRNFAPLNAEVPFIKYGVFRQEIPYFFSCPYANYATELGCFSRLHAAAYTRSAAFDAKNTGHCTFPPPSVLLKRRAFLPVTPRFSALEGTPDIVKILQGPHPVFKVFQNRFPDLGTGECAIFFTAVPHPRQPASATAVRSPGKGGGKGRRKGAHRRQKEMGKGAGKTGMNGNGREDFPPCQEKTSKKFDDTILTFSPVLLNRVDKKSIIPG